MSRHELTGAIKSVQGRHSHAQLVNCVGLLQEAWREALQLLGPSMTLADDEDSHDEEAQDELDVQDFAELVSNALERFRWPELEPLYKHLEDEVRSWQ